MKGSIETTLAAPDTDSSKADSAFKRHIADTVLFFKSTTWNSVCTINVGNAEGEKRDLDEYLLIKIRGFRRVFNAQTYGINLASSIIE
jgi:hypothetical protein